MAATQDQAILSQPSRALTRSEQRRQWMHRHRDAVLAWTILTPILIYFFMFNVFPVALNVLVSFTEWNGIAGSPVWTGLSNYAEYLHGDYPLIIGNTAIFSVAILAIQTVLAFCVAVLLNQRIGFRAWYRAAWYIPTLTSAAIMAQVILIFIAPYGGVLNNVLASFGLKPFIWPLDPNGSRLVIILYSVWRGVGGPIVLFLAALQGIHQELYEAAKVDGANDRNLLRYITIPLLRPMIEFVLVTGFIGNFQIFEAVLLITKGGPRNQTNTMLLQIYNDAFINNRLGLAAAGAVIMVIILLWFSISAMRMLNRQGQVEQ
jgi:ABC-type sugar transport system permease subunit